MISVRSEPQAEIVERLALQIWGTPQSARFYGLASFQHDRFLGGFLYSNYKEIALGKFSIDMHMAGSPGWLTRRTLREFFAYPFEFCRCARVIGPVLAGNKRSADITRRFGFTLDGVIRSGIAPQYDLMLWTMTRNECRWLR